MVQNYIRNILNRQGGKQRGFTIVELLIVIAVIAILAAIVLTSYQGTQAQARDAKRKSDVKALIDALEVYYQDNGFYPPSDAGTLSTAINGYWKTTADSSWSTFATQLEPYLGDMPRDPTSTPGINVTNSSTTGFDFAYFSNPTGAYCGTAANQMYMLVFRMESTDQVNSTDGTCTGSQLTYYSGASNYLKTRNF
jgi:general secretion pathway protein G